MSGPAGVVLDAGVFVAIERRDVPVVGLLARLARAETPLVTSAGVVAQVWRGGTGRQVPVALLLRRTTVVDLTHAVARALGSMLGAAGRADPVDAHVVWIAQERGWPILTGDAEDLLALDPTLTIERI